MTLTSLPSYLQRPAFEYKLAKARRDSADTAQYQTNIDLTAFKKKMWRGYVHTNYQALIDRTLEQVALYIRSQGAEGLSRVMIFLPPRKGKTATVSRHFPAWIMGQMPNTRLIMTSYGASLAGRNSRFVRNLIKSHRFQQLFPEVRLAQDTQSTFEWDIANFDGGMIAAGVGGGITGHGANLIIIDDPIKSRAEAESAVYRQNIKDWYNDDLSTRLEEPGGAIVIIQTRWHQDDLSGWLLDSHNDNWYVLSLPEIAEKDDPLGRKPGDVLWPERYSIDWVLGRQESLGEYSFASLYQQRPIPAGGGLFDALKIKIISESEAPKCVQSVRFYDLAVTVKKTSDYTVGFKLGVTADEQFVIQHVWRVRKEAPDVQEGIVQNAAVDGPNVAIRLEAENAGISQLGYLLRDSRLRGHQIDAKPPIGDKYTRAGPAASRVNNGRVLMVRGTWNQAVLDEFAVFPNGKHDDIVDGFSGAYEMLTTHKPQSWHTTRATGLYKRR